VPVASQVKQISKIYDDPNTLRCIVSSSAPLDSEPTPLSRMRPVCNCYGTTEVSIATSTDSTTPVGSVGLPVYGVNVEIADDGEILVETPYLFDGYYNQPETTEDAMSSEFFKTGDLGCVDDEENLFYLGRIKELINVGGTKVYPQDVEAVLSGFHAVQECAAFPQVDDALGEVVALAIVLDQERIKNNIVDWKVFNWTREIQALCLPFLTDAQLPRAVHIVDALPKTETGKVQRGKLADIYGGVR